MITGTAQLFFLPLRSLIFMKEEFYEIFEELFDGAAIQL